MLNEIINARVEAISEEIAAVQGAMAKMSYKKNPELYLGKARRHELLDKTRMALRECKGRTESETLRKLNGLVRKFYNTYTTPYQRDELSAKDAALMEAITDECLNIISLA